MATVFRMQGNIEAADQFLHARGFRQAELLQ